jgi:uncharacterized protein YjdB
VAATGVTLNKGAVSLTVGSTEALMPTIAPENATNQGINWISSDTSKAVVSSGGVVTALSEGAAVVTVATVDGGNMATCTVTVSPAPAAPIHPTGVTLDQTTLTLPAGSASALAATVVPSDATNKNVYWLSNAPGVAVVSSLGLVTAVSPGAATITVATVDGGRAATCAVVVNSAAGAPATGVALNRHGMSLALGESEPIVATVLPTYAANRAVSWATSNANIATVSAAGIVTATGRGAATITATTVDGGYTASCDATLVNVYVPGADNELQLLKNGASLPMEWMEVPPGSSYYSVQYVSHAFAADGGDVYASSRVGTLLREYDDVQGKTLYVQYIPVWKNGLIHQTIRNDGYDGYYRNSLGGVLFQAECLFASGNDVYLAGVGVERNPQSFRPMLWKNGVSQPLELFNAGVGQPWGTSVFVSGGDVYMVGRDVRTGPQPTNLATLWKNGVATYLNSGTGQGIAPPSMSLAPMCTWADKKALKGITAPLSGRMAWPSTMQCRRAA